MADGEITDDQRLNAYADWIRANKDKAGSPEFVKVSDAYRSLRAPQLGGPDAGTGGVGDANAAGGASADSGDESNAGGVYSTLGRVGTAALAGPVDIAGRGINVVADVADKSGFTDFSRRNNVLDKMGVTQPAETPGPSPSAPVTLSSPYSWSWLGSKLGMVKPEDVQPVTRTFTGQVPSLTQGLRSVTGVEEMPEDAGLVRQTLEGLGTAALSGPGAITAAYRAAPNAISGVGAGVRSLIPNAVIPYAGSVAGEKLGGIAGEAVGGETGRGLGEYLGGIAGGVGANSVVRPWVERGVQGYYATRYGRPDVGEVVQQAREEGVDPTFGMLANRQGRHLEQSLNETPGVENARLTAQDQIRTAVNRMADRRQEIPPSTPGNADIVSVANQMREIKQPAGPAVEQVLLNRVGAETPTGTQSIYDQWEALRNRNASAAGALTPRLSPMFESIPRDAQGNPNIPIPPPARYLPPAQPPVPPPRALPSNVVPLRPGIGQPAGPAPPPTPIRPNVQTPPAAYSQVAGARSLLGEDLPNAQRIPGGMKRAMYGTLTDTMREAAGSRGVDPQAFDTAHRIFANERNAAAMRDKIATTVGQDKAQAFNQFANYAENLQRDPGKFAHVTGSDQPGTIQDVSRSMQNLGGLSRAVNIATEQGGMARNVAEVLRHHTPRGMRFLITELLHGQGRLLESNLVRQGLMGQRASMAPRATTNPQLAQALAVINQRQYRPPGQ